VATASDMSPPAPTRVLIVDDHALVREGLAEILRAQPDFRVVGEASDGVEAVAAARELCPDIVLMDLTMPSLDGLGATRLLTGGQHDWKIVILTIRADKSGLLEAINAGASGYLLKTMHAADLLRALRGMRAGEPPLAATLKGHVLEELKRLSAQPPQAHAPSLPALTRRERDVLALADQGSSDKQIARTLCVSIYTVKTHMRNILAKLHAGGRREAAVYARRAGLL
jgi:two-component system, NarL family, response regulator LiaR